MGSVELNTKSTLLRYISEWDPRENAHTKGGYIEGEIKVPESYGQQLIMEVQTYPAADIEHSVQGFHPCLLHAVRMGKGKRDQEKEPVPTHNHWKQRFLIQREKVSIINKMSSLDINKDNSPRNVPNLDMVTELQGKTIVMGRKRGELNLILLQPKQRNRAKSDEATLTTVLADRMQLQVGDSKVESLEKLFKGKQGQNLKRIRIRVDFYNMQGERVCNPAVSPQTIIDTGSKEIGCMDFYDSSPHKSCSKGGRKIIMVSEYNLSKKVSPIFQVFDQKGCLRNDMEKYVKQPEEINVKNQAIIFITPEQKELHHITNQIGNFHLRLRALRAKDGYVSEKFFNFRYVDHEESGQCMFCDYKVDSDEIVQIEAGIHRAKPRQPKRVMNNTGVRGEGKKARLNTDDKTWMDQLVVSKPISFEGPVLNLSQQTDQQNSIQMKGEPNSGIASPSSSVSSNLHYSPYQQEECSPNRQRSPHYSSGIPVSTNLYQSPHHNINQQQIAEMERSISNSSSESELVVNLIPLPNVSEPLIFEGQFEDEVSVLEVLGLESIGTQENNNVINNETKMMTLEELNSNVNITDIDMLFNMADSNCEDPYSQTDIDFLCNNYLNPSLVMNSSSDPMVSHGSVSVIKDKPLVDSMVYNGSTSATRGLPVNLQRRYTIQTDGAQKLQVGSQVTYIKGEQLIGDCNKHETQKENNKYQDDQFMENKLAREEIEITNEDDNKEYQNDSFTEDIPFLILLFFISFFILQIISDVIIFLPFFSVIILSFLLPFSSLYLSNKRVNLCS